MTNKKDKKKIKCCYCGRDITNKRKIEVGMDESYPEYACYNCARNLRIVM